MHPKQIINDVPRMALILMMSSLGARGNSGVYVWETYDDEAGDAERAAIKRDATIMLIII